MAATYPLRLILLSGRRKSDWLRLVARWLHPDAESPALCRFGEILATRSATKREVVRVELIAMLHAGERRFDVLSDCPTFLKGGVRSWN